MTRIGNTTIRYPSKPKLESGWVLVKDRNGQLEYFSIKTGTISWSTDSLDALRMARKEDVENLCMVIYSSLTGMRVEEHGWG